MNCTLFLAFIQKLKQHTLYPLFVQLTLAGYSPEVLLDASYVNCCLLQVHAGVDPGFYMSDLHQLN